MLVLGVSFIFFNCETEQIAEEQNSAIETVSSNEALNLFSQSFKPSKTSRTSNHEFVIPHLDQITQEALTNSNALLTTIPAYTFNGVYSRILLIKIDGEVKSAVSSMVNDENSSTEAFSGMIYIHTLQKEYINTFKVENGIIVSRFKKPTGVNKTNNAMGRGEADCWGIACGMDGEEIVITTRSWKIEFAWIFKDLGGDSNGTNISWEYGFGESGGSTSNNSEANEETTCGSNYVLDSYGNCVINPLFGVDCRSFEYAQAPGEFQKACAVKNFGNNFYYGFFRSDGSWQVGYFPTNIPLIYFTMPSYMSNGQASNLTAEAVTAAIRATDAYVFANADGLTEQEVRDQFTLNIRNAMNLVGGSMAKTAPFVIPSPAPYLTSLFGAKTDCN